MQQLICFFRSLLPNVQNAPVMPTSYLPSSPFHTATAPLMPTYYTLAEIGGRVQAARQKRKETQQDAAKRFGCTQSAVSQAERGFSQMEGLLRQMAAHYLGWRYSDEEYRKRLD